MDFSFVYLYHSGFALCFPDFTVLIDYYEDSAGPEQGILHEKLLQRPGPLYVLSSHFHADHFNPDIFHFDKDDMHYILSKDIYKKRKKWLPVDDIAFLSEGDSYVTEHFKVKAYDSTDSGVSFYLEAGGLKLFHAGDLNNWHWREESTPEESAGYEKAFATVLKKIQAEVPALDIAFFPADPRLGKDYLLGPMQFMQAIACRYMVPMHFDGAYDKALALKQMELPQGCQALVPEVRGQVFTPVL